MPIESKKADSIHWLSVLLGYSTLFLFGITDNLRGPLFPEVLRDLNLSDTQGSMLWATSSFAGFLASLFATKVIHQWSLFSGLKISLLMMAIGHALMALSYSLPMALVSALIFGFSLGLLGVLQNLLILQSGPASQMSRLQAGLHSNYAAASLLTPLMLTAIYAFSPGWRPGYVAGAALSFLGFLSLFFIRKDHLSIHQPTSGLVKSVGPGTHRRAIYMGLILGLYVVAEIMVSSRLALYMTREAGYGFSQASVATTLFFLGLFLGRFLFIFIKLKWKLKTQMVLSLASTVIVLLMGLGIHPWFLAASGLTMAPFFPLAMSYLGEKFPRNLALAASYMMTMDGILIVLMHMYFGVISDGFGIRTALVIGPVACLLSMFMLVIESRIFINEK